MLLGNHAGMGIHGGHPGPIPGQGAPPPLVPPPTHHQPPAGNANEGSPTIGNFSYFLMLN